jgi:hypothetical protein
VNRDDIRQDERDSADVDEWMREYGHEWNKDPAHPDVWTWDRQHHAARQEFFAFGPGDYGDGTDDNVDENNPEGVQDLVRQASIVADHEANEAWDLADLRGEPYGGV